METDAIYKLMRNKIVKLEYEPGQILNELEIAEQFEISRTPVRRIFQLLCSDKLLNIIPRFGAQVAPIDFKYMKSVFEVTRVMDPYAARLATERISPESLQELEAIVERLKHYDINSEYQQAIDDDERFHQIVYASCANPCLQDLLISLHYHTERLWHYCEQNFDDIYLFYGTLGDVLEAIKRKDMDSVERLSRDHIDMFVEKVRKEMF